MQLAAGADVEIEIIAVTDRIESELDPRVELERIGGTDRAVRLGLAVGGPIPGRPQ
jgi:hypothetical protein